MCQAIEEMRRDAWEEGFALGFETGYMLSFADLPADHYTVLLDIFRPKIIQGIMDHLKCSAQKAMDLLRISASDQSKYLAKL